MEPLGNEWLIFGGIREERKVSTASAQHLLKHYPFSRVGFLSVDGGVYEEDPHRVLAWENPFFRDYQPAGNRLLTGRDLGEWKKLFQGHLFFLALHGGEAENGVLQRFFDEVGVFYSGSGSHASELAFFKDRARAEIQKSGLVVPMGYIFPNPNDVEDFLFRHTNQSWVVKPADSGSSFGLQIFDQGTNWSKIFQRWKEEVRNFSFSSFLVEERIFGREFTVGWIDQSPLLPAQALEPSEVITEQTRVFDYQAKYQGDGVKEVTPADVDSVLKAKLQNVAEMAHKALRCYGYSRTDLMWDGKHLYFLEINTLPGLSERSFIPQQLQASGISFKTFILSQIWLAKNRAAMGR